tara:strand:+ start:637 stop:972 length:336 start_codon:yes stop_codon:yes gene_type:complete
VFPYLDYYGEESGLIRFDFGLDDLVSGTLNDGVHEKQFEISKFVDPGTLEMEQIVLGGVLENENWDFDDGFHENLQQTFEIVNTHFVGVLPELGRSVTLNPLIVDASEEPA